MIRSVIKKIKRYYYGIMPLSINHNVVFSERIKNRQKIFWGPLNASKIKNTIMHAHDPIEKWKDIKNWQLKLSNKYNSREFAKKFNCRVADLYWEGNDVSKIPFNKLSKNYVIRPTIGWGSGLVFLMDNGINLMDGKTYSEHEIKRILAQALSKNKDLIFLFEEFIKTEEGVYKIPSDYKFYTFNGEVACIQVITRMGRSEGSATCYNEQWQQIENITIHYPKGEYQQPPKCMPEMLAKAKELSVAYEIFVRIDFYATDKGTVFGEFTLFPVNGQHFTDEANKLFTAYWDKFCNGKI